MGALAAVHCRHALANTWLGHDDVRDLYSSHKSSKATKILNAKYLTHETSHTDEPSCIIEQRSYARDHNSCDQTIGLTSMNCL